MGTLSENRYQVTTHNLPGENPLWSLIRCIAVLCFYHSSIIKTYEQKAAKLTNMSDLLKRAMIDYLQLLMCSVCASLMMDISSCICLTKLGITTNTHCSMQNSNSRATS